MQPLTWRDRLIAEHAGAARRIALQMARRCPATIAREDLVAAGMLGLTEAASRYNETRTDPFLPFAAPRIRGAILDELRRGDPLSVRGRQQARKVKLAIRALETRSGEPPTEQAIADALGVSLETYRDQLARLVHVNVRSLDEQDAPEVAGDQLPVDEDAERNQLLAKVRAALGELPARDATVLGLYYMEELTLQEIATSMQIGTSQAHRLVGRAIERLRERLCGPALTPLAVPPPAPAATHATHAAHDAPLLRAA